MSSDYPDTTAECHHRIDELRRQVKELEHVLDRRPESVARRWIEDGAFALGVLVVVAAIFDLPWLDVSAWELSLAVAILIAPKMLGKAFARDLVKGLFSQIGSAAAAIARRKRNDG